MDWQCAYTLGSIAIKAFWADELYISLPSQTKLI